MQLDWNNSAASAAICAGKYLLMEIAFQFAGKIIKVENEMIAGELAAAGLRSMAAVDEAAADLSILIRMREIEKNRNLLLVNGCRSQPMLDGGLSKERACPEDTCGKRSCRQQTNVIHKKAAVHDVTGKVVQMCNLPAADLYWEGTEQAECESVRGNAG